MIGRIREFGTTPEVLTRHFKQDDEKYIRAGSLRGGSLAYYRSSFEGGPMRMSDAEEGLSITRVASKSPRVNALVDGIHINMLQFEAKYPGVTYISETSAFVFCFSAGRYSRQRHEYLINGCGPYDGDTKFTSYAEFDTHTVLLGISIGIRNKFPLLSDAELFSRMRIGRVRYEEEHVLYAQTDSWQLLPNTVSDEIRSIFFKPTRFSVEEEFRIAFLPPAGTACGVDEKLIVSNPTISSSVKRPRRYPD